MNSHNYVAGMFGGIVKALALPRGCKSSTIAAFFSAIALSTAAVMVLKKDSLPARVHDTKSTAAIGSRSSRHAMKRTTRQLSGGKTCEAVGQDLLLAQVHEFDED